jgi:hypothetical protein
LLVKCWYVNIETSLFLQKQIISDFFSKNLGVAHFLKSFSKITIFQNGFPKKKSFCTPLKLLKMDFFQNPYLASLVRGTLYLYALNEQWWIEYSIRVIFEISLGRVRPLSAGGHS